MRNFKYLGSYHLVPDGYGLSDKLTLTEKHFQLQNGVWVWDYGGDWGLRETIVHVGKRASGEGSLYYNQKKELWVAQITLPIGKRKTKYGKTQKEVKTWLQEQRETVSKGTYVENDQVTLSAFLEEYMTAASNNLRTKTVDSYLYLIRKHISPELGEIKLSQLSATQLHAFYNAKIASGLFIRTVQYMQAVLYKALD